MAETASRSEARAPSDGGPLSALRIAPADDDKFFPVEAFRLEPGAPVGLVTAVDPFRDDAFKPVLAAHPMEGRALADLMIVIPKRSPAYRQGVFPAALCDRPAAKRSDFRRQETAGRTGRWPGVGAHAEECGPITDPQLHQQCLASFSQDEPMVASAASHRRVASSRHHAKQHVGSSAGPRHYQSHLGK